MCNHHRNTYMITPQELKNYIHQLASEIGVENKITSIQIRKMKHKIASCSSKGRLTFDPEILHYDQNETKHIIVNELLHLRYKNHSRMFKAMLNYYVSRDGT